MVVIIHVQRVGTGFFKVNFLGLQFRRTNEENYELLLFFSCPINRRRSNLILLIQLIGVLCFQFDLIGFIRFVRIFSSLR